MHHCLSISEIQHAIVAYLGPIEGKISRAEYRTLLSLGLSCKDLFPAAMAALWSRQKSILPLIKCMPTGLWGVKPGQTSGRPGPWRFVIFNRAVVSEDWSRALVYSQFVQELVLEDPTHTVLRFEPDVVDALLASLPSPPFPNLQKISWNYWSCKHSGQLDFISKALTSNISKLAICGPQPETPAIIETIIAKSPESLLSLNVTEWKRSVTPHIDNIMSAAIQAYQNLREVEIDPVSLPIAIALSHLPRLEKLKTLSSRFLEPDFDDGIPLTFDINTLPPPGTFPSLSSLTTGVVANLSDEVLNASLALAKMIGPKTHLQDLELRFRDGDFTYAITKFFDVFTPTRFSKTLRSFRITTNPDWYDPPSFNDSVDPGDFDARFIVDALDHVKEFTLLERVYVESFVPIPGMTNELLINVFTKWSNLKELVIMYGYHFQRSIVPEATLDILVPIADMCPLLTKLCITVDARDVPQLPANMTRRGSSPSIEDFRHRVPIGLFMSDSPIIDLSSVADFLTSIFWNVSVMGPHDDEDEVSRRTIWKEVGLVVSRVRKSRIKGVV